LGIGIAFSWSGRYRDKLRITEVNDAVDLLTTFFFILMGTILPFDKWADIGT
jgi:NhaP-type Na+/H+ or K+/H+ antiporter